MDLVVSNLALHWTSAPEAALAEAQRVLRRGGLLMFSTLGPDSLKELAQASVDAQGRSPVHRFIDMHDLGDLLVNSGFADPVMDMEYLTLTYPRMEDLFRDLRGSGALSAVLERLGCAPRVGASALAQRYERLRRDGRLPATFEIVYGHAWKPEQGPRVTADGSAVDSFRPPTAQGLTLSGTGRRRAGSARRCRASDARATPRLRLDSGPVLAMAHTVCYISPRFEDGDRQLGRLEKSYRGWNSDRCQGIRRVPPHRETE